MLIIQAHITSNVGLIPPSSEQHQHDRWTPLKGVMITFEFNNITSNKINQHHTFCCSIGSLSQSTSSKSIPFERFPHRAQARWASSSSDRSHLINLWTKHMVYFYHNIHLISPRQHSVGQTKPSGFDPIQLNHL